MTHTRNCSGLLGLLALSLASCSGGSAGEGGGAGSFDLVQVTNGFSQLLPHKVLVLDGAGEPTTTIRAIRTMDDLTENVRTGNPILPTPNYPVSTILPSGAPGNHFMLVEFTQDVAINSVLTSSPGQLQQNSLTGALLFQSVDPASGTTSLLSGRVFINGYTYAAPAVGSPPQLQLQRWIGDDGQAIGFDTSGDGNPDFYPGLGFPGTQGSFTGQGDLISTRSVVFVPDADDNLTTHDTFPTGATILARLETGITNTQGRNLARTAVAAATVGPDTLSPEVLISLPPSSTPVITPGNGEQDVDPLTTVLVSLSEPVQPWTIGNLPITTSPSLSAAISLQFGPQTNRVTVPFSVLPRSVYDLTLWELTPAYNFPGEGPVIAACGTFSRVDVTVSAAQIGDLAGNINSLPATTFFDTGEGPGLVNAPVSPDAIYVGRGGASPGISVIDLNGWGAGTGNPVYDDSFATFTEGDTLFPLNPNVRLQGTLIVPPLVPGSCTVNGGSAGVFTLTKDSSLNDLVVRTPLILKADDMMLGHALDSTFNNAPAPFGCQSGGGNLCALDGQKLIQVMQGSANTLIPNLPLVVNNPILNTLAAGENVISFAPHPNPPPLIFPPLCVSPYIGSLEPTSIFTILPLPPAPPPNGLGLQNILKPGDAFGNPNSGQPPGGLLSPEQNSWFQGPQTPQANILACLPYMMRQQVGQFLYVLDRSRNELVIFNSNNMRVLDRIEIPDPTSMAMSPNLDYIAISNQSVNLVTFIDINPKSSTFHSVIQQTVVGDSPRGIAWEPGNEDILVCCEGDNTLSVISAFSLQQRKSLSSQLNQPFDLAITGRQQGYGFNRGVYFAYILNRNGRLATFESGPNSVNGWGFDDIVGSSQFLFQNPKTIQVDHINLASAVWIVHEGPIDPATGAEGPVGVPAVSNLKVESAIFGQLPLNVGSLLIPQFRDMSLQVDVSLGNDVLSGVPVDVAFDNLRNFGALTNLFTNFSSGVPLPSNGKSLVRTVAQVANANEPKYMFVAIPNPTFGSEGLVDVIDIGGGNNLVDTNAYRPGIQSIPCTSAQVLMDYWRQ